MRVPVFLLLIFAFFLNPLFAAGVISISGTQIPVIEGAKADQEEEILSGEARIATYFTERPLEEAISFYESFFKGNGFAVIGGRDSTGFNVAVKKGNSMFSLRIFTQAGRTAIQFIW